MLYMMTVSSRRFFAALLLLEQSQEDRVRARIRRATFFRLLHIDETVIVVPASRTHTFKLRVVIRVTRAILRLRSQIVWIDRKWFAAFASIAATRECRAFAETRW